MRGWHRDKIPLEVRFEKYVVKRDGCWGWTGCKDSHGYPMIAPPYDPANRCRRKSLRGHRVSWEMVHGEIPQGMLICHKCDNPECCNPSHLFLGTRGDNNKDRSAKGRNGKPNNKGEVNGKSVLTAEDVMEMRGLKRNFGLSYKELATAYGVGVSAAFNAVVGKTWGHIPGALSA